jgi:uncharacterized protein (DUF342 family)
MKISKKKKSIQALEDAYLDAIVPKDEPTEEFAEESIEELNLPEDNGGHIQAPDIAGGIPATEPPGADNNDPAWQEKELLVAEDGMSVTLKLDGGPAISTYQINAALTELGVVHGIDWQELAEAEQVSKYTGMAKIVVARGTPPETRQSIKFVAVKKVQVGSEITWMAGDKQIDFAHLAALYEQKKLSFLDEDVPKVRAVNPGDILVKVETNKGAKSGKDIFGKEISPGETPPPELGENVRFNDAKKCIESRIFGYLLIDSETISVLPPVWYSDDKMQAYFIHLPQFAPRKLPTSSHLRLILIQSGLVEECKRKQVIDAICEKLSEGKKLKKRYVLIAEAIPPKPGKNARLDLCFDNEIKAGTERENGSLDLRERNVVVSIQEGSQIAVKTLATKGVDGCDIFGKKIQAKSGNDLNIAVDKLIRVEKNDYTIVYFAKKSGNVKFKKNKLIISDIHKISGDVDYNTGNIDVNTDLLIKGSVLPGFSVKSKGNISIEGSIDNGATIFAEGDISVNKGILGESTKVIVLGGLHTAFIQDAEVIVKGNVTVSSYLYNSMLRANGSIAILMAQGLKSGRAVGGVTCSSTDINLSTAGNVSNQHTVLAIQPNPETCREVNRLAENCQLCEQNISKITRTLPFDTFEPTRIKEKLAGVPPARREPVVQLLTNLNKLIKQQKILKAKRQAIKDEMDNALLAAKIRITSEIFIGCEIQIGDKKLLLDKDMGPAIFQLENGVITH